MTPEARKTWAIRGTAGLVAILLLAGGFSFIRSMLQEGKANKQVVHNISLIKQPPPPPPKPPEHPPDPPKVKEEVKVPEDQPKPDDKPADDKPPSDQPLAVDAAGGAGSDNFGLAGRIGGKDLLATGGGGAYFTGLIQRQLYEALVRSKKLARKEFKVVVLIDLDSAGKIQRSKVVSGSGSTDLDQDILTTLNEMPPLKEIPPPNLREVEVRLSNRG